MSSEIEKLKIEHARYKQALKSLHDDCEETSWTWREADAALNPPPPRPTEPVTLVNLLSALKTYSGNHGLTYILFFHDESGGLEHDGDRIFTFESLQEAYDFLTQ